MWIKTMYGALVNLNNVNSIYSDVEEVHQTRYEDKQFRVVAETAAHKYILARFTTEAQAAAEVKRLSVFLGADYSPKGEPKKVKVKCEG